jgi:hypothetical protein
LGHFTPQPPQFDESPAMFTHESSGTEPLSMVQMANCREGSLIGAPTHEQVPPWHCAVRASHQ